MTTQEIVKSLILLQESMQKMREEGECDLRCLIMKVEHLIMSI